MADLKAIKYKEDRLDFFKSQRDATQKRCDRLEKALKPDEPYLSEQRQFLSDCGRELSYYEDAIALFEKDLRKPDNNASERANSEWQYNCPSCGADMHGKNTSRMKVYLARKGCSLEKAIEREDVEMIRVFKNENGQSVLELSFPGNQRAGYSINDFDFWVVSQDGK